MPVMAGDSGANPAQRVGIALSYARRYALMNALGIAPEDDTDAGAEDVKHREPRRARAPEEAQTAQKEPEQVEDESAAPDPTHVPFDAVQMVSRMHGSVDKLGDYFGAGKVTKTALEKMKVSEPEEFHARFDRLHTDFLAWKDQHG